MIELTLLERLKLILDLVFSSPLFLILIIGFILIIIDIFIISKKSKRTKIVYLLLSIILILVLLNHYYEPLLNVFDTIFKNIVKIIYFPSILEYILVLLGSLVIIIISTVSKKTNIVVRTINLGVFAINILLFFLILDQISKLEVDLNNQISIYSNEILMSLFEGSIILFSIWLIGLILYSVISKINHKNNIKQITDESINNFYDEPELPKTIEEMRKEVLIPPPQIEYIVVEKKNDNDMFTLDEYRQMKKVLEYIKEKQQK